MELFKLKIENALMDEIVSYHYILRKNFPDNSIYNRIRNNTKINIPIELVFKYFNNLVGFRGTDNNEPYFSLYSENSENEFLFGIKETIDGDVIIENIYPITYSFVKVNNKYIFENPNKLKQNLISLLKKFKNGDKLFHESALFNNAIMHLSNGMNIYHLLEEIITINDEINEQLKNNLFKQ